MIELNRWASSEEMGTFGTLQHNGEFICYTVEKPYRDNQPFISCVPTGEYELIPFSSSKYGDTYALYSEANRVYVNNRGRGRYACLFHPANIEDELNGCIAPGLHLGYYRQKWAVTSSRDAFAKLLPYLSNNRLVIS